MPGLDRARLHRHGDERADGEHEQEDHRRAVQRAGLVGARRTRGRSRSRRGRSAARSRAASAADRTPSRRTARRPGRSSRTAARGSCRAPGRRSWGRMSYAPAGTKNDAIQTSTSTAASTVNAVGNLSCLVAGPGGDAAGSGAALVLAMRRSIRPAMSATRKRTRLAGGCTHDSRGAGAVGAPPARRQAERTSTSRPARGLRRRSGEQRIAFGVAAARQDAAAGRRSGRPPCATRCRASRRAWARARASP